jgi:predicted MPP superfamily phosphohydrolase
VQGNVDPSGWEEIFEGVPSVSFDRTRGVDAGIVHITGLSVDDSFDSSLRIPASDKFHIVLGHAPNFALGDVQADLLVAGHTHGGQVRLPWFGPIVTFSSIPRSWATGATRLSGNRWLVVSSGVGLERGPAPRLRFLCRPEIAVIHVDPSPN